MVQRLRSYNSTNHASPKGDPAGFVHVIDDRTIAIPERKGNKRADGYRNVLANPHVGLLFLIPGRGDTLRINGRAHLVSDAPWFGDLVVKDHRPVLTLVVEIVHLTERPDQPVAALEDYYGAQYSTGLY